MSSLEEFEIFALSPEGGLSAGHLVKGEDGEYLNFAAQCYWDFWQGSRAALAPEIERLQRFETAYKEFSDKTDWVRPNAATHELGMHVADVIRKRCDDLTAHCQAQADEIKALRGLLVQCALCATTLRTDGGILAEHSGFSEKFVAVLRKHSAVEPGHGVGSPMYPSQRDAVALVAQAVKP